MIEARTQGEREVQEEDEEEAQEEVEDNSATGETESEVEDDTGAEEASAEESEPESEPEPEPLPIDTDPERTTKDLLAGKNKAAIEEAYTRCSEKIGKLKKAVWQTPPDLGKLAIMEATLDSFINAANEIIAIFDTKGSK